MIGKASFDTPSLADNLRVVLEELERAKPAASKGRYFRRITLSSTMGPGIKVDPNRMFEIEDDPGLGQRFGPRPIVVRRGGRATSPVRSTDHN